MYSGNLVGFFIFKSGMYSDALVLPIFAQGFVFPNAGWNSCNWRIVVGVVIFLSFDQVLSISSNERMPENQCPII